MRPSEPHDLPISHASHFSAPASEYVPAYFGFLMLLSNSYTNNNKTQTKHMVGIAGFEHSYPAVQFSGELVKWFSHFE